MSASPSSNSSGVQTVVIQPSRGWMSVDFGEIWRYRELFGFLVWRDIKVKYKQTLLGFAWAIIGPLANTFIFTILFGRLGKLPTDGLPPAVFYMIGLVLWRYFSQSLTMTSNSLVGNQALLTKIYVPRLILPTTPLLTGLVDFLIAFAVLILVMFYFHTIPAVTILLTPFLILITMGTAMGMGLFFAALNVRYRDVRQLVPFLIQLWMYATIIIPFSKLPERWGNWRYLYGLNPMGGAVEAFRWCLAHHKMVSVKVVESTIPSLPDKLASTQKVIVEPLANQTLLLTLQERLLSPPAPFPWLLVAIGLGSMTLMLLIGLWAFKRMERQFADIV